MSVLGRLGQCGCLSWKRYRLVQLFLADKLTLVTISSRCILSRNDTCYLCSGSPRYCTHITSEDLNACVELLLSELVRFQDRQFLINPTKAKAKRRYVCGLREVTKHLKLKRLKCIIVPPNLDKIQSTGTYTTWLVPLTELWYWCST